VSTSFELDDVDHFTTGTVGPPGQRVFYLQVRGSGQLVSLRLEKTQVAALVTYLAAMLDDLPSPGGPARGAGSGPAGAPGAEGGPAMDLIEPAVAEWVVGSIGVSYDEQADRVLLVAEELVAERDGQGDDTPDAPDAASARIHLTRAQVAAFARHGAAVVAAGRPPCPLCGAPLDPEGHVCVRLNGHRRPTS